MEVADRMRSENFEQFQTLVRMHLSFELDLNIDATDADGIHCVKPKPKRRFNFPIRSKHLLHSHSSSSSSSSSSSKAGNPPFNIKQSLNATGIEQIKKMIKFLVQDQNIVQEGIFRRTGSMARQHDLRRRINEQSELNLDDGVYTVHDCASVLKGILADLPEPLLTDYFYSAYCQIADLCSSNECNQAKELRLLHTMQLLQLLLPLENRLLLNDIMDMLNEITKFESVNKMSAESLATLFTPHLICPRKLAPEALHTISQNLSGIISFMITKAKELQDIPPKLATDIRAYFLEQKRKKILSPEMQMLNESVTSDSTANTVYTFVDREKTAEAHIQNSTDTALAQLYAYIQTLPESSKKRKLIKQFNKENGQGTPLQQQMMMRLRNGNVNPPRSNKLFCGSIKKHIFSNTLVSRTPKRTSVATAVNYTTPVVQRNLNEKTNGRLIFHTPGKEPNKSLNENGSALKNTSLLVRTPNIPTILETNLDECKTLPEKPVLQEIEETDQPSSQSPETKNSDAVTTLVVRTPSIQTYTDSIDDMQTPSSFSMHKFVTCFKSEPNLSKVLKEKNRSNSPMLHRGRYIARKLLSGVSMINLGIPFSAHVHEKMNPKKGENRASSDSLDNMHCRDFDSHQTNGYCKCNQAVLNDQVNNKENLLNIQIALNKRENSLIKCENLSDSLGRDSVSPITKSTHRMPKAMQESIMTPRSRKPVIISAMLNMTGDPYNKSFLNDEKDIDLEHHNQTLYNSPLHKSKSESEIIDALSSPHRSTQLLAPEEALSIKISNSSSEEALSTPFRKYLFSRSLLMATPVDSSFSSQSDDFENLNDSEMNESLIYCLDGNEPEFMTSDDSMEVDDDDDDDDDLEQPSIQRNYVYDVNGDTMATTNNSIVNTCRKRHTNADENNINIEFTKISSSVKKKIIHLDETAL